MPECAYCGETIDGEAAYLDHLREAHLDELGPIDRRRVSTDEGGLALPTGPLAIGVVLLASAVVVGYVIFLPGGGGAGPNEGPTNLWGVHYHGTIEVIIDGERLDFSRDRWQLRADAFHFEGNEGNRWHGHAELVTLAWAMDTLGIDVTATTVTYEGTTYDDAGPDTMVSVAVDGEPVDPATYVLEEGDAIRIVVEVS